MLATYTNANSAAYDSLYAALNSIGGMAGTDTAAREWGKQFDETLGAAFTAHHTSIESLASCAELTAATATNHANADGASVIGPKPAPQQLGIQSHNLVDSVCLWAPPSVIGFTIPHGRPSWWGKIVDKVGDCWPDGDTGRLRSAAIALRTVSSKLNGAADSVAEPIAIVRAQISPEIDPAVLTISAVQCGMKSIANVYYKLAHGCDELARHIEKARKEIIEAAAELTLWTAIDVIGGGSATGMLVRVSMRIIAIYNRFAELLAALRIPLRAAADVARGDSIALSPIAKATSKAASFGSVDKNALALTRLTSADRKALGDYTGSGYLELNNALRAGKLTPELQARVDAINAALAKLPDYKGPVSRGTTLPAETLEKYKPGAVITEDAFTSTSKETSKAFTGNTRFEILSKTGKFVEKYTKIPGEQEVLFPPGVRFSVIERSTDPKTGTTIIRMMEE